MHTHGHAMAGQMSESASGQDLDADRRIGQTKTYVHVCTYVFAGSHRFTTGIGGGHHDRSSGQAHHNIQTLQQRQYNGSICKQEICTGRRRSALPRVRSHRVYDPPRTAVRNAAGSYPPIHPSGHLSFGRHHNAGMRQVCDCHLHAIVEWSAQTFPRGMDRIVVADHRFPAGRTLCSPESIGVDGVPELAPGYFQRVEPNKNGASDH